MKTIKKIIGVLLICSPFIGLGMLSWHDGRLLEFLVAMFFVGVLVGIIWLGVKLILD